MRPYWPCNPIETVPRRGYRFTEPVLLESSAQQHIAAPAPMPSAARARKRFFWPAAVAAVLAIAIGTGGYVARSRPAGYPAQGLSADGARLYAMGMFYWNQRTGQSVQKSLRYFQDVIASDPRDARGYAGVASAYAIEGDYGFRPFSKRAAFARALAYAKRALAVDPRSAEAHAALGLAT